VSLPSDPSSLPASDGDAGVFPRADAPSAARTPSVPADRGSGRRDRDHAADRTSGTRGILSALPWPPEVQERFLASGAQQQPEVSRDTYAELSDDVRELQRRARRTLMARHDRHDPVGH
jgi:hypothetical protein